MSSFSQNFFKNFRFLSLYSLIPSSIAIASITKSFRLEKIFLSKYKTLVESFPPEQATKILSFFSINLNSLIVFLTFFSKYLKKQLLHNRLYTGLSLHLLQLTTRNHTQYLYFIFLLHFVININ